MKGKITLNRDYILMSNRKLSTSNYSVLCYIFLVPPLTFHIFHTKPHSSLANPLFPDSSSPKFISSIPLPPNTQSLYTFSFQAKHHPLYAHHPPSYPRKMRKYLLKLVDFQNGILYYKKILGALAQLVRATES